MVNLKLFDTINAKLVDKTRQNLFKPSESKQTPEWNKMSLTERLPLLIKLAMSEKFGQVSVESPFKSVSFDVVDSNEVVKSKTSTVFEEGRVFSSTATKKQRISPKLDNMLCYMYFPDTKLNAKRTQPTTELNKPRYTTEIGMKTCKRPRESDVTLGYKNDHKRVKNSINRALLNPNIVDPKELLFFKNKLLKKNLLKKNLLKKKLGKEKKDLI